MHKRIELKREPNAPFFLFLSPQHMRPLKLFIACSLDGFIADQDGKLDFLNAFQESDDDYGYSLFFKSADTILLGRKTYDAVIAMNIPFPYEGKECFVFSRKQSKEDRYVRFINDELISFVRDLKTSKGGMIYCDGGGSVITQLLAAQLVDEITLSVIPVLLGGGTRLFQEHPSLYGNLALIACKYYPNGLVQLRYELQKKN
jgi:dihydrofolate reductase